MKKDSVNKDIERYMKKIELLNRLEDANSSLKNWLKLENSNKLDQTIPVISERDNAYLWKK